MEDRKKKDMSINIWPGWHIVQKIGSGSFGAVYEIHRGNGAYLEKAALKVIRIPSSPVELEQLRADGIRAGDTESYLAKQVEDIRSEIGLMQRFVGFSNIVSYEDYMIQRHSQGVGWDILIRMELLTGLSSYMAAHPLTERDVLKIGLDISQALIICHSAGIIHRDIKPQNIFMNNLGFYKLGDFGISRPLSRSGSSMSFKGTVSYMAPETFSMRSSDVRSDIYSLALVMYRILNGGREPFLPSAGITPAQREAAQLRRLRGEPLPRPERGSDMLWRVLAAALAPDPAARYQTAEHFHADLQKVAALLGVRTGLDITNAQGFKNAQGEHNLKGVQNMRGLKNALSTQKAPTDRNGRKKESFRQTGRIGGRKRAILLALLITASIVLLMAGIYEIIELKGSTGKRHDTAKASGISVIENNTELEQGVDEAKETIQAGAMSGNAESPEAQSADYAGYAEKADRADAAEYSAEKTDPDDLETGESLALSGEEEDGTGDSDQWGLQIEYGQEENEGDDIVEFSDEALEKAVQEALKITDRKITMEEAAACTELRLTGGAKSGAGKISDLTGLSAFSNLEVLYLDQNRISDISELGLIHTLKIVNLEYNYISDLAPVAALSNLEQLELRENTVHDISPVSYCQELKVLDFRDNVVDDISSLQDMISLKQLVMSGNRIESLDPVSDLKDLWYLSFNKNPVNDINPVRNLQNLTTLCMSGTDVEDIGVLFELPVLGYVDISGCDRISKDSVKKLKERKGLRVVE